MASSEITDSASGSGCRTPRVPTGQIINYTIAEYPFEPLVREALRGQDLSKLHEIATYGLFRRETDQKTIWHERYYSAFEIQIAPLYRAFVERVIGPLFDEPIAAQSIPTLRIQLPENVGVGEFHRDRDYRHPEGEVNFLLPLTRAWGTNTIWIESSEGAEDYAAVDMAYGQVFCFDGLNLRHGNRINQTGCTRVSFDFRATPDRLCTGVAGTSINTGTPFCLGGYYFRVARLNTGSNASTQKEA